MCTFKAFKIFKNTYFVSYCGHVLIIIRSKNIYHRLTTVNQRCHQAGWVGKVIGATGLYLHQKINVLLNLETCR